jgi:YHS domain-containing protein
METWLYFLLWAGLIFLMMRFGCGAHIMGHGRGHGDSKSENATLNPQRIRPPAREIDPVCGMTVETASSRSSVFDGRIYYFCSANCRDRFEANPQAFAEPTGVSTQPKEHGHGSYH